jgi:hypothetical protein
MQHAVGSRRRVFGKETAGAGPRATGSWHAPPLSNPAQLEVSTQLGVYEKFGLSYTPAAAWPAGHSACADNAAEQQMAGDEVFDDFQTFVGPAAYKQWQPVRSGHRDRAAPFLRSCISPAVGGTESRRVARCLLRATCGAVECFGRATVAARQPLAAQRVAINWQQADCHMHSTQVAQASATRANDTGS